MTGGGARAGQVVFEDRRWRERPQGVAWRHRAAARLVRGEPVLDVGGGDGLLLSLLRDRGYGRLEMVDLSAVAVERAVDAGFDAQVLDLTGPLPFPDGHFATGCALDVLEHLHDPLPVLRELARVSREVVVAVPNFHYWKGRLEMLGGRVPFQCRPQRGHVHWFDPATLDRLAAEAGLRIDERLVEGSARLGPAGDTLARTWPKLFAVSLAVRLLPR